MHGCDPAVEAPKELGKIEQEMKHRARQAHNEVAKASNAVARAAAQKGLSREQMEARMGAWGGVHSYSYYYSCWSLFLFLFYSFIGSFGQRQRWR